MRSVEVRAWLKDQGYRYTEIAGDLGINEKTVGDAIRNRTKSRRIVRWLLERGCPAEILASGGVLSRRAGRPRKERIKRVCLKCDKVFLAEGRFNRLCPICTNANRTISSAAVRYRSLAP